MMKKVKISDNVHAIVQADPVDGHLVFTVKPEHAFRFLHVAELAIIESGSISAKIEPIERRSPYCFYKLTRVINYN